jgi:hypothetical protein
LAAERCKSISANEISVQKNERGALIKVPYFRLFRRQEVSGTRGESDEPLIEAWHQRYVSRARKIALRPPLASVGSGR